MPISNKPSLDADEAFEALHALAHATRPIDDPTEVYFVLGSLSAGLASLEQVLHQPGHLHDGHSHKVTWVTDDPRADRASMYQVTWELHRAAEIVHQVAASIDRAQAAEATIAHDAPDCPTPAHDHCATREPGLSL